jgi:hypothetical protein
MTKIKVVTGYVPVQNSPRSAAEYGALGEKLRELKVPVQPFYGNVSSTWMYQMVEHLPFYPTHSIADNPKKNTFDYQCATYQRFQWLYEASRIDDKSDVFVWLDYGICHIPGVTPNVINACLERVRDDDAITIPGCWPVGEVQDEFPCWRFCGGFIVVPRKYVQPFKNLIQALSLLHVSATKNITWDVNTMARAEQTGKLPFRWYQADHNETMFNNYPEAA